MKKLLISLSLSTLLLTSRAEEGLWIPMLLQQYNINIMQKEGLRLSAEDIYSINQASLKDAIVIFGSGCTGELISDEGLLLTNHHCGISAIQSHSSVENDYISKGFWAMSRGEELPNKSLKVTFLIRIEDVTSQVLDSISPGIDEQIRDSIVDSHIARLKKESVANTGYKSVIKPFYYGNEYYMFIYQEYTDIRLVGAPPNAIGNYGEDFDNWVWPRHTGDFSLFRIYAGKNNEPAAYSPENIPYKPKKHLSISTSGVKEGDFTMVMGYPGTTNEYIIADEIAYMLSTSLPKKVAIRDARLKILDKYMIHNDTIRIMYAAKYRGISNAWKKWQGVIMGLESTDALTKKRMTEDRFQEWTQTSPERTREYGNILPGLRSLNIQFSRYSLVYEYSGESVLATELIDFALDVNTFLASSEGRSREEKTIAVTGFKNTVEGFFKNYKPAIDQETFAAMLEYYYRDINREFHPALFELIQKKYKGDFKKFAADTYAKSVFCKKEALLALLDQYVENSEKVNKRLYKDPAIQIYKSFADMYTSQVIPYYDVIDKKMEVLYRTYMRGLREMQSDRVFYPDANFTMRVAYGKAEGYQPADAVTYKYSTNLSGVIEKYRSDTVNYALPARLIDMYSRKDYGRWADKNGELPVCFAASNHTSGGNSGSPVLNADGHLIGINFDRNWEGTMSDISYDVSICRNIAVDIRYVLFIVDKYAGAGYLMGEMELVE
jgi:V8-like Glu-specific endopeptidase